MFPLVWLVKKKLVKNLPSAGTKHKILPVVFLKGFPPFFFRVLGAAFYNKGKKAYLKLNLNFVFFFFVFVVWGFKSTTLCILTGAPKI